MEYDPFIGEFICTLAFYQQKNGKHVGIKGGNGGNETFQVRAASTFPNYAVHVITYKQFIITFW